MALTGLQIFKHLPGGKKEKEANCKSCGFPTCMAFAMKLAKGDVDINKCEFASEELKSILNEANKLQQAEVKFGNNDCPVITGNETVMFRHEKTFVNKTVLSVQIKSSEPDFKLKIEDIINYSIEKVGEVFKVDAITLIDDSIDFVNKAIELLNRNISTILVSENIEKLNEILKSTEQNIPIIFLKTSEHNEIFSLAEKFKVPVVLSADSVEELTELKDKPCNSILNISNNKHIIQYLTYLRRSAIEDKTEELAYPVISFIDDYTDANDDIIDKTILASSLLCKYSNIVVLDEFNTAQLNTLITLRQNIYTDPQKPLQMEPKMYIIGEVTPNSPVIVTTNFALTYFTVASEVESSGVGTYLILTKSDGMSVLTAWAANKFTGEIISKAIKDSNIEEMVNHKNIIIPGYVSSLKQEVEEDIPDWNIIVGTNEAVDIPDFLKKFKSACTTCL